MVNKQSGSWWMQCCGICDHEMHFLEKQKPLRDEHRDCDEITTVHRPKESMKTHKQTTPNMARITAMLDTSEARVVVTDSARAASSGLADSQIRDM